jgi:hypothetical protein
MIGLYRSLLRQEGVRVPSGGAPSFAKRVRALELAEELQDVIEPLLKTHEHVCAQIELADKKIAQAAASSRMDALSPLQRILLCLMCCSPNDPSYASRACEA